MMNHVWLSYYYYIIDLNLVELKYYPFLVTLDKCGGSCKFQFLIVKTMCSKKNKRQNFTAFKMINKNEAKPMTKHVSCDCKFKINRSKCNSVQKWNNETRQCECNNYPK